MITDTTESAIDQITRLSRECGGLESEGGRLRRALERIVRESTRAVKRDKSSDMAEILRIAVAALDGLR